jgi:hypothetical protein
MPTLTKSNHTERLGVAELSKICARASQILREVNLRDVGIDAFIEIDLDGSATGVLIGVQISYRKTAIQIVELIEQSPRDDLREGGAV